MEEVQLYARPLAFAVAKSVVVKDDSTMAANNQTLKFTGAPESGGDVVYDF